MKKLFLAKVTGNVVSTQKNKYLKGHKLLIVKEIDLNQNLTDGKDIVAIDMISSGIGDIVLVCQEGDAVQQVLGHGNAPLHTMIIANVDEISCPKLNI